MARALKNGITALGMPLIIFGGVYGGIFTVTEAAAVAAAYAIFVEFIIHRGVKWQDLPAIAIETGVTTSIVLFLCSGAMVLARFLTLEQIPQMWAEQIFDVVKDKWVFMFFINVFLLVTGCLVDVLSAIVILMPIFKPLYLKFGIDEIYFAGRIFIEYVYRLSNPSCGNQYIRRIGHVQGIFCRLLQSLCALLCNDDDHLGSGDLISIFVDLASQFIFAVNFDGVHWKGNRQETGIEKHEEMKILSG